MYAELLRILHSMGRFGIALSGGLDSRFLAYSSLRAGCDFMCLTATGCHVPAEETDLAAEWCRGLGIRHVAVPVDVLAVPEVAVNSRDRCYGCKLMVFAVLKEAACGSVLADGTNADDLRSFRPGLRALRELGIRSPLAEAGLNKEDIRSLAAHTGLDRPHQAARPCLLTRLDYGMAPAVPLLERIGRAEAAVAALGIEEFRLRLKPGAAPVLQVAEDVEPDLLDMLLASLDRNGFSGAEIVSGVSVSGYFDRRGREY